MLSKSCTYGIQAALYLATQPEAAFVPVRQISDHLHLSCSFLAKVLQHLTRQGLLQSYRGPNGGVALARPAAQVRLKDLVVALDGPALFEACVLGLAGCGSDRPCPLHEQWNVVRGCIDTSFAGVTLAEVVQQKNLDLWSGGRGRPGSAE